MSEALYGLGGLRFWTEREIYVREQAIQSLFGALENAFLTINSAWTFHRVEGPILTPGPAISMAYTEDDIFELRARLGDHMGALRAETTASSYLYAEHILKTTRMKPPMCVWQAGKSFRRENLDGARPSTLRYNEFWQQEFQCVYQEGTHADYRGAAEQAISREIKKITISDDVRLVDSDRLPSYSTQTRDIEVPWRPGGGEPVWKEMCSISTRTDFPQPSNPQAKRLVVLEVAVGLDRLVAVEASNYPRTKGA